MKSAMLPRNLASAPIEGSQQRNIVTASRTIDEVANADCGPARPAQFRVEPRNLQ